MNLEFACTLFEAVAPPGGNFVYSPWSVACALAALAPGVDAEARTEIEAALARGEAPASVVARLRADAAQLIQTPRPEGSLLLVTNRLWVDEQREVRQPFAAALEGWPGTGVLPAPIAADPDKARRAINDDVATATRGLIPEILPPGTLDAMTAVVLVNTVYLLAAWAEPFHIGATRPEPFHAPDGTRDVAMMRAGRFADHAARTGWEYLRLPLGSGIGAEIVLPPDRLPSVPRLGAGTLTALREAAATRQVDLHLPRFRVSGAAELPGALRGLGVARIFDPAARAVSEVVDRPAHVSQALHQAVLRLDEAGVEGAAATALALRLLGRARPVTEMVVDRPFYALVTHRQTGTILFMARITAPA